MDSPTAPTTPRPRPDGPALQAFVDEKWDREIVPALTDYITIPAKSPAFDADWVAHGYIDQVVRNAVGWLQSQPVRNLTVEILRLPGRTPVIYFEAPATRKDAGDAVLMYGHLDKQPEFSGWRSGLGPWTPKYLDGKLYGRGGADDGYAVYASLTAVLALDRQGIPRPRCIGLIETCEESGSYDLLPYVEALRERMGQVALVVCLDSGQAITTSSGSRRRCAGW
ncbi:Acetylornithine deacetylase/succinyl-diaminopimelate desuccinylase-like protein OS=Castellaniella defragrans OX=75697 GN=HNR28_001197 PE=4 SV=1 [Castellaniella defragrans]